jgi:hypothetical protein
MPGDHPPGTFKDPMKPVKLSVSSFKTLQSCEQKYFYYKVANTPKDSDYKESDSQGLGKAFHQVMEKTLHTSWDEKLLMEAMIEHSVPIQERALLEVMCRKYVEYHKVSGVKVVKCELPIETSTEILFIDAIGLVLDATKKPIGWCIIDLKTAARHDENLLPQLARDPQMNFYAKFAGDVDLAVPEAKGLPFLGCRYRQILKSKAATPRGLESGVKVIDIEIPVESLNVKDFAALFSTVYDRAVQLHQGEAPTRNLASCFNYFSPCQYFSQCHGDLFSKNHNKVRVHTLETQLSGDLL